MVEPVHFIASGNAVEIYRGSVLVARIERDKLPALVYEAAKVLRGQ